MCFRIATRIATTMGSRMGSRIVSKIRRGKFSDVSILKSSLTFAQPPTSKSKTCDRTVSKIYSKMAKRMVNRAGSK
jgi:hypothetical protein